MKKSMFFFFFFFLMTYTARADDELKLIVKNVAGYPIYHLSISEISKDPEIDLLDKPLQDNESVDIFLRKGKKNLLLWLFNEDYSKVAIELGRDIESIETLEIRNDGSVRFILRDDDDGYVKKKR